MFEHLARVWSAGRLTQPSEPGLLCVGLALEQLVEMVAVVARQRVVQQAIKVSVGARDRLGADAFDNVERRNDDMPLTQIIEHLPRENYSLVRLHGQLAQPVYRLSVGDDAKRGQAQITPQLQQVLTTGRLAGRVLRPARWINAKRLADPLQHHLTGLSVNRQFLPWKAQQAKLHGETQPVGVAPALAVQRQVSFAERIPSNQVVAVLRQYQQRFPFEGGQADLAGHDHTGRRRWTIPYPPIWRKTSPRNMAVPQRLTSKVLAPYQRSASITTPHAAAG